MERKPVPRQPEDQLISLEQTEKELEQLRSKCEDLKKSESYFQSAFLISVVLAGALIVLLAIVNSAFSDNGVIHTTWKLVLFAVIGFPIVTFVLSVIISSGCDRLVFEGCAEKSTKFICLVIVPAFFALALICSVSSFNEAKKAAAYDQKTAVEHAVYENTEQLTAQYKKELQEQENASSEDTEIKYGEAVNFGGPEVGGGEILAGDGAIHEPTVYVTESGAKYHMEDCPYLTDSAEPYLLSYAIECGYEPCSRCNPPTQ